MSTDYSSGKVLFLSLTKERQTGTTAAYFHSHSARVVSADVKIARI
jgi:hypothetical protein